MLSLIIPIYRNEENLDDLLRAVAALNTQLRGALEAVFVVDGSPDRCYEILRDRLPACDFRSQLVLLVRNFGSFSAIRAGLEAGNGDHFAVMAADLQEPPELILTMHEVLQRDEADVVVGVRESREDPWSTRLSSGIFWGLYRRYVISEMPPGGIDIFACNRAFRDQILRLEERHSSLIAQIFWLGFRRRFVPYKRRKRVKGQSAWTFQKRVTYLMDSIFSFTDLPIRLLTRIGGFTAFFAAALGSVIVISRQLGLITVPGYTANILAVIFFGALNIFCVGVVGAYTWRAYENTKGRPLHAVLRTHAFNTVPSRAVRVKTS